MITFADVNKELERMERSYKRDLYTVKEILMARAPSSGKQPLPGSIDFGLISKDMEHEMSARDMAAILYNVNTALNHKPVFHI